MWKNFTTWIFLKFSEETRQKIKDYELRTKQWEQLAYSNLERHLRRAIYHGTKDSQDIVDYSLSKFAAKLEKNKVRVLDQDFVEIGRYQINMNKVVNNVVNTEQSVKIVLEHGNPIVLDGEEAKKYLAFIRGGYRINLNNFNLEDQETNRRMEILSSEK